MEPQQTSYDVALREINSVVTKNCSGLVEPSLTVKTFGTETVTSMEIEITDENSNIINTFDWSGNESSGETFEVRIPEFDIQGANTLNFNIKKINNNDDAYPFDNFGSVNIEQAESYPGDILVQIKTPSDPNNLIFEIWNMSTNELFEEYHFEQGHHAYQFDVSLPTTGCYRFNVINPNGTGCENGFGKIKDMSGNIIMQYTSSVNKFTYKYSAEMDCNIAGVEENQMNNVVVYPNPASSRINIEGEIYEVNIYNALGQLVYTKNESMNGLSIDVATFEEGLYLVNIKDINGLESSQRIIIKK